MASSSGSITSAVDDDHQKNKIMMVNNNSGSDQDHPVDQRKRKRMLSNRESARRSRMRKQKHLDDLVSQAGELKKDNGQILTSINITTQLYARLEAENSILRAQMAELTNRLQSLNDIINCINSSNNCLFESNNNNTVVDHHDDLGDVDYNNQMMINMMNNPWNSIPMNQPIMASADQMYMY